MKTGVKLVRLEPQEGIFTFEWLDEAVELFSARGIDVVLCTPTSCPPSTVTWSAPMRPNMPHRL